MTRQSILGRLGLTTTFVAFAATAAAVALTPQDKGRARGGAGTGDAPSIKKQREADREKEMEQRKKDELQKKHDHQKKVNDARYGGEVDPNAKLEVGFEKDKYDFGLVTQGQVLEHTFLVKSAGTSDLVIRQAKPTCGCTVSQTLVESAEGEFVPYVMGDKIAPGKSIKITASMDTKNKTNKAEVRINVYTNDQVGLYQLGLAATVEAFMTATPSYLNLGDLAEDTVRSEVITVRTSKEVPILLHIDESQPRPMPAGLSLALSPVNPNPEGKSSQWKIEVNVGPGLKEGPMGYSMRLVSDQPITGGKKAAEAEGKASASTYQINANIGGRVLGVLSCAPQYLSMGLVRPGQPVARSVRLTSHDANFELGELKARVEGAAGADFPWGEHFTPIVRPIEGQSSAVEVELRLDGLPDGSEGSFKGEMVIETGHPSKPEVRVTFSGVCRAGVGRSTQNGK